MVLFSISISVFSQYSYPEIDGCNIINELFSDIKEGKLDLNTYEKHFDEHNEIEVVLEFEWCRNNNINQEDCQSTVVEHFGDSSFSFAIIKTKTDLKINEKTSSQKCSPISDIQRTSYYMVDSNQDKYIFQLDKKFKGISDIVSDDLKSIFFGDNLNRTFYKELFEKNPQE